MKKVYFLLFLLMANSILLQAQQRDCGLPTCEEPGDPGLTASREKVHVYPNPSNGRFSVDVDYYSKSKSSITILDENGKIITRNAVELNGKPKTLSFDVSNQVSGIYIVRLESDKGVETAKVLLVR